MKKSILLLTLLVVGLFVYDASAQTPTVVTSTETIYGATITARIQYLPGQLYSAPTVSLNGGTPVSSVLESHSGGIINMDKFHAVVDGWDVYVTITGNFSIGWRIYNIEAIVP